MHLNGALWTEHLCVPEPLAARGLLLLVAVVKGTAASYCPLLFLVSD